MMLHFVLLFISALAAEPAFAGAWAPFGPADGGIQRNFGGLQPGAVVTHPAAAGVAMIAAGFIPGDASPATAFTSNGGGAWSTNPPPGGFGRAWLAGTPTIAYWSDSGRILRSPDTGRTWAPVPEPVLPPLTNFTLGGVNPGNANELVGWAGATVYRTVDGGAVWSSDPAPTTINALDVDWTTRTIFVSFTGNGSLGHRPLDMPGAWGVGGQGVFVFAAEHGVAIYHVAGGGIFRSIDGGTTFAPAAQPPGEFSVCQFAFSTSPSKRAYAAECEGARLLRSDDDGATWTLAADFAERYVGSLAVDAGNPDRVYVMTGHGTRVSSDGAMTFGELPRASGAPGDIRLAFFDAVVATRQWLSRRLSDGAAPSILRSEDAGGTWSEVDASHFVLGASRSRASTLFAVDEGGRAFVVSIDGGATWASKFGFADRFVTLGPLAYGQAAGELYVASVRGNTSGVTARAVHYSNDDGETFSERFAPPLSIDAMVATPSGPPILYAGGGALAAGEPQLYRSINGAVTWQPVAFFPAPLSSFGGTYGNHITAVAIDPSNPSRLYAGFAFPDYVMRSDDAGATWVRATSGLGAGGVTALLVDPADPSVLYASQDGGGVFRSGDRGATWAALDEGLHEETVLGLVVRPLVAGRLYAATRTGAYRADLTTGVPAGDRRAIEYYHAAFNHYFVSSDLDEVAVLDAGVFQGWARTGQGFRVTAPTATGNLPVCRFFSVGFAPLSSHFYTPYPAECDIVKSDPKWLYEKIAFGLALPEPPTRGCASGARALYRLWNQNENGAPNHRYTTSTLTFDAMLAQGWIFEGEAPTRVFACVPY